MWLVLSLRTTLYLCCIERGDYNPSLELVFRISELFGLPMEAVFSREPFKPLSEEVYGREATGEGAGAVDPLDAKTRGGAR